jgi:RND superfamily putative drug exporter
MLGLAVAIDYALFIVSRYRNEMTATGHEPEEAAGAPSAPPDPRSSSPA